MFFSFFVFKRNENSLKLNIQCFVSIIHQYFQFWTLRCLKHFKENVWTNVYIYVENTKCPHSCKSVIMVSAYKVIRGIQIHTYDIYYYAYSKIDYLDQTPSLHCWKNPMSFHFSRVTLIKSNIWKVLNLSIITFVKSDIYQDWHS